MIGGQTLNYMRRVSLQKHHTREIKLKGLQGGKFLHDSLKNVDKRKKSAAISNALKIKCVVAFSENDFLCNQLCVLITTV